MTHPDPEVPDSALTTHIVFFDVDRDGRITREEIHQALQELGFSRIASAILAPVLALALPSQVKDLKEFRHADSGSFDRDGRFDEGVFVAWWNETDLDGSGDLSRWELLLGSVRLADDATSLIASVAEFQLLHLLLAEDGALSRKPVEQFLNGELFLKIMRQREEAKNS
jgi:hypothetical protein